MDIGRRIYYELSTGIPLVNTGERSGAVVETTAEQDFEVYTILNERVPTTVGMLQLEYGQFRQDFEKCSSYRVNLQTGKLEFSYPDPSEGEEEPTEPKYQQPLTEQIEALMLRTEVNEAAILALLDLGL